MEVYYFDSCPLSINRSNLFPREQIKVMEHKYHEAEEERINRQVAMEMELEKKQNDLDQACKDLQKIQKEIVKVDSVNYLLVSST